MSQIVRAVRDWAAEIVAGWNRFWFTPADPATLGLIRICAGAMLFYTHLVWSLNLQAFFGPHGWLPASSVRLLQRDTWSWSYLWWLRVAVALWSAHLAALVAFALLTIGLWSARRRSFRSSPRWPMSAARRDRCSDSIRSTRLLAMYLAVGPCGAAFSVDRWLARRRTGVAPPVRPSWTANLAIRLIQLHMCIIYLFAGTAKLTGPAWWDGTALWMAFGNMEYQSLDMTWMADWPQLINVMTHVTIFWEISYIALVWPRSPGPSCCCWPFRSTWESPSAWA